MEAKDSVGYLVRKDYVLTKRCTSPSTTSVTAAVEYSQLSLDKELLPPVLLEEVALEDLTRLLACLFALEHISCAAFCGIHCSVRQNYNNNDLNDIQEEIKYC